MILCILQFWKLGKNVKKIMGKSSVKQCIVIANGTT